MRDGSRSAGSILRRGRKLGTGGPPEWWLSSPARREGIVSSRASIPSTPAIYLPEDHSAGETAQGSYTFSDGRWMKRTMAVGDQIIASNNYEQYFTPGNTSCTPTSSGYFPYVMTLEQHMP
jgi:hypothetical protein